MRYEHLPLYPLLRQMLTLHQVIPPFDLHLFVESQVGR